MLNEETKTEPDLVYYHLEGHSHHNNPWAVIDRRSTLEQAQKDEAAYRSFMNETSWIDLRIVKVTTTREIISPNIEDVDASRPKSQPTKQ